MNKENLKKRLPLILAIGVPVVFLLAMIIVAWLPTLLARPKYDFIYYTTTNSAGYFALSEAYSIENGKLTQVCKQADGMDSSVAPLNTKTGLKAGADYLANSCDEDYYSKITFYRYDVNAKKSIRLSEQQLMGLTLLDEAVSSDGYRLQQGSDDAPFWGGSYNTNSSYYLVGNGARIKLDTLQVNRRDAYQDVFVGWVQ